MGTLVESTSFAVIGFFIIWALYNKILKERESRIMEVAAYCDNAVWISLNSICSGHA